MLKNSKNSKNGLKGNLFKLLSKLNNNELITIKTISAYKRPLKHI
jgi:hypothetical protein